MQSSENTQKIKMNNKDGWYPRHEELTTVKILVVLSYTAYLYKENVYNVYMSKGVHVRKRIKHLSWWGDLSSHCTSMLLYLPKE